MNFSRLNLDSEGAFSIAEEQAKSVKLGFDSVNYLLRCEDSNSAPVWVIQLLDDKRRTLGSISIAADTGAVIAKDFGNDRGGPTAPSSSKVPARENSARPPNDSNDEEGKVSIHAIGHRVERAVHHFGANLEEFFTGRRTLDRRFREDDDR